ncbi:hypothetical protein AXF42_Ash000836 [Apostasia shenzhenica]|uniref:Uncharacterized protein n=1 Tax=Apostasia shenzhenica TaxID=1088818 RepID=A0A2I0AT67_9ASPA|nr:hypothetical protein AXF42_Ash000836 [Apostasia shenzhenica]
MASTRRPLLLSRAAVIGIAVVLHLLLILCATAVTSSSLENLPQGYMRMTVFGGVTVDAVCHGVFQLYLRRVHYQDYLGNYGGDLHFDSALNAGFRVIGSRIEYVGVFLAHNDYHLRVYKISVIVRGLFFSVGNMDASTGRILAIIRIPHGIEIYP